MSKYNIGKPKMRNAVIGDKARMYVHDTSFQQMWEKSASELDLVQLASELETLRQELDAARAEIGAAAREVERGDGPAVLHHLKAAGPWALNAATSIGTSVAAAAIKMSMGA